MSSLQAAVKITPQNEKLLAVTLLSLFTQQKSDNIRLYLLSESDFHAGHLEWLADSFGQQTLYAKPEDTAEIDGLYLLSEYDLIHGDLKTELPCFTADFFSTDFSNIASIDELRATPCILDYSAAPPWRGGHLHHFSELLWWDYAKKTEFAGELMQSSIYETLSDPFEKKLIDDLTARHKTGSAKLKEAIAVFEKLRSGL